MVQSTSTAQPKIVDGGAVLNINCGNLIDLDGVNDLLDGGANSLGISNGATGLTIDAWVYVDTFANFPAIVGVEKAASPYGGFKLGLNTSGVDFAVNKSGTWTTWDNTGGTPAESTATWYHMVGVYDGTNITRYSDGSTDGSYSASGTIGIPAGLDNAKIGGWPTATYMDAKVAAIRVWANDLSSGDVSTEYTNTKTFKDNTLLTNLVAWYPMTETSGTTMVDSHTGGYDGTLPTGPSKPTLPGTHYSFDSANSEYATIPDNDVFSFTDEVFSIQFWMRSSTIGGNCLYKGSTTANREYAMGTTGSGFPIGQIFNNGSATTEYPEGVTNVVDGAWHHIVFIGDGTNLYIYVDGVLEDTEVIDYNMGNYASAVNIARYGGGSNYWTGDMKKLAFWDAALTRRQVRQLYNGGVGDGLNYSDLA